MLNALNQKYLLINSLYFVYNSQFLSCFDISVRWFSMWLVSVQEREFMFSRPFLWWRQKWVINIRMKEAFNHQKIHHRRLLWNLIKEKCFISCENQQYKKLQSVMDSTWDYKTLYYSLLPPPSKSRLKCENEAENKYRGKKIRK